MRMETEVGAKCLQAKYARIANNTDTGRGTQGPPQGSDMDG